MNPSTYAILALYLAGSLQALALIEEGISQGKAKSGPRWGRFTISLCWFPICIVTIINILAAKMKRWLK